MGEHRSTTVEITIGYLTSRMHPVPVASTTVEITIGYLTKCSNRFSFLSTTVEITIGYLTDYCQYQTLWIYNSRNYYRLLNPQPYCPSKMNLQQ